MRRELRSGEECGNLVVIRIKSLVFTKDIVAAFINITASAYLLIEIYSNFKKLWPL